MRFARRTVTYSDVAIRKGPSRNILMPLEVEQVWTSVWHTQRKSPEVPLGGIQTLGLSLVSLVRIYDLFIVAAWKKLKDVDGLPLFTASTTRLPFIHVRSVGNQTAYSEDDHVHSVAPGTCSGWEEPKRTKRNCNAIIRKTHEHQWKPWKVMGCPVSGGFVGLTTVVYPVHIDELWVRCVRARPRQNYWASMLVERGLQST